MLSYQFNEPDHSSSFIYSITSLCSTIDQLLRSTTTLINLIIRLCSFIP